MSLSCSQQDAKVEASSESDSVLIKSQAQLEISTIQNQKADSTMKVKTQKIVEKISFLNREVNKYKLERESLLTQQVKVVYKVDTVYIETKKNFWGKSKTSTSVKSDSSVSETMDTTKSVSVDSVSIQKIDTLKNN